MSFHEKIASIPTIKAYLESPRYAVPPGMSQPGMFA